MARRLIQGFSGKPLGTAPTFEYPVSFESGIKMVSPSGMFLDDESTAAHGAFEVRSSSVSNFKIRALCPQKITSRKRAPTRRRRELKNGNGRADEKGRYQKVRHSDSGLAILKVDMHAPSLRPSCLGPRNALSGSAIRAPTRDAYLILQLIDDLTSSP
jgi:hypothetical protein